MKSRKAQLRGCSPPAKTRSPKAMTAQELRRLPDRAYYAMKTKGE